MYIHVCIYIIITMVSIIREKTALPVKDQYTTYIRKNTEDGL